MNFEQKKSILIVGTKSSTMPAAVQLLTNTQNDEVRAIAIIRVKEMNKRLTDL